MFFSIQTRSTIKLSNIYYFLSEIIRSNLDTSTWKVMMQDASDSLNKIKYVDWSHKGKLFSSTLVVMYTTVVLIIVFCCHSETWTVYDNPTTCKDQSTEEDCTNFVGDNSNFHGCSWKNARSSTTCDYDQVCCVGTSIKHAQSLHSWEITEGKFSCDFFWIVLVCLIF